MNPADLGARARASSPEETAADLYRAEQAAYVAYAQAMHRETLAFEAWLAANPTALTRDIVVAYETSHTDSRRLQREFLALFANQDHRMAAALGIDPLRIGI